MRYGRLACKKRLDTSKRTYELKRSDTERRRRADTTVKRKAKAHERYDEQRNRCTARTHLSFRAVRLAVVVGLRDPRRSGLWLARAHGRRRLIRGIIRGASRRLGFIGIHKNPTLRCLRAASLPALRS